jgi:hypothetical protein
VFVRGCLDLLAGVNDTSSATQFGRGFPTEALPPVLRNHRCQSNVIRFFVRSCPCAPSGGRTGLDLAADRPQERRHLPRDGGDYHSLALAGPISRR